MITQREVEKKTLLETVTLSDDQAISPDLILEAHPTVVSPGETFTLKGKLIIPKQYGDVNGDGVIDIYDMITVARSYGATPGTPYWNPDADLNGDGVIDIYDIIKLGTFFGQQAGGKPIEIQQYTDGVWTRVASLTTERDGSFSLEMTAPSTAGTLYFRAYFPGGEYYP